MGRWSASVVRFVSLAVLLLSRPALPCSPLLCPPPVRTFGTGAEVPGNQIYFQISSAGDPGPLQLKKGDGSLVPARIRTLGKDRVFAPDEPVVAGTELSLFYRAACGTTTPAQHEYRFRAGPHGVPELRPAELEIYEQGTRGPGSLYNEAGFVRVRYYDPVANGIGLHLVESTITVDGRPFQLDQQASLAAGFPVIEVLSDCMLRSEKDAPDYRVDTCGKLSSVPPGKHTVTVQPRLIGSEKVIAPVSVEVTTSCPRGLVPTPSSSATPIPPKSSATAPAVAAAPPPAPKSKRFGCAFSAPPAGARSSAWLGGLLVLVAARRVTSWRARRPSRT